MTPIVLSQSLWMFSVWLVFTSNLNRSTLKSSKKLPSKVNDSFWAYKLVNITSFLARDVWHNVLHAGPVLVM